MPFAYWMNDVKDSRSALPYCMLSMCLMTTVRSEYNIIFAFFSTLDILAEGTGQSAVA